MDQELQKLKSEIKRLRITGPGAILVCEIKEQQKSIEFDADARKAADKFLESLGYEVQIEERNWPQINNSEAKKILTHALQYFLPFPPSLTTEIMPFDLAAGFVEQFLHFFEEPMYIFSQVSRPGHPYLPVIDTTFEQGVVVISNSLAGILFIGDED